MTRPHLNWGWQDLSLSNLIPTVCVVGGMDDVVSSESARGFWGTKNVRTVVGATHRDLVKPKNHEDLRYQVLRRFLEDISDTLRGRYPEQEALHGDLHALHQEASITASAIPMPAEPGDSTVAPAEKATFQRISG